MYLELNDVIYPNNSIVQLSDIGTGNSSLHCHTSLQGCCGTAGMRQGQFYFPNGTTVPIEGDNYEMYRNRGGDFIRLNRRFPSCDTASAVGTYRCEIPDGLNVTQALYITLK